MGSFDLDAEHERLPNQDQLIGSDKSTADSSRCCVTMTAREDDPECRQSSSSRCPSCRSRCYQTPLSSAVELSSTRLPVVGSARRCSTRVWSRQTTAAVAVLLGLIAGCLPRTAESSLICPRSEPKCTVVEDSTFIYSMTCGGYGSLDQLPAGCSEPRMITTLNVGGNNTRIAQLQAGILDGLSVQQLNLSGLGIRSVDAAAFNRVASNLQRLVLSNNQLTSLPDGVFRNLGQVTLLELVNNRLTNLSNDIFVGMDNLLYLALSGNDISTIGLRTWLPLGKLDTLDLVGNLLTSVDSFAASCPPSLRRLDVRSNSIASLPDRTFTGCPQLLELDLSYNSIRSVTAFTFNGTSSLTKLKFSNNHLDALPNSVFAGFNSLDVLHLQNNRISFIDSNSLAGLVALRDLDLSHNRIPLLPLGVFDVTGNLVTLDLADNVISVVVARPFQSCRNLVALNLSSNAIRKIDVDWFSTMEMLTTLRLERNQISLIATGAFNSLQRLVNLNLSDNRVSNISGLFRNCSALKTLDLSRNPLGRLAAAGTIFDGLRSLTQLNLSGACLQDINFPPSGAGSSLPSLVEINLAENLLQNITASTLGGLTTLRSIDLSSNNIISVERASFASLVSLAKLNLSLNWLTDEVTLAATVQLVPDVVLDLSWNRLHSLTALPNRTGGISVYGNPLVCDCYGLPAWITSTSGNLLMDSNKTLCSLSGQPTRLSCFVSQCGTTADVGRCAAPPGSGSDYLQGGSTASRLPMLCSLDAAVTVYGPRFVEFSAQPASSVSMQLNWTLIDVYGILLGHRVTVVDDWNNCTNITDVLLPGWTTNTSSWSTVFPVDANQTGCVVDNLTSGRAFVACAQAVASAGSRNNRTSAVSDARCACVKLPIALRPSIPVLAVSTVSTDSSVEVTWRVENASADAQFYFRLSCVGDRTNMSTTVMPNKARNLPPPDQYTYVISNLTSGSSFNVCVEAIAMDGRSPNLTQCLSTVTTTTTTTTTTTIATATTPQTSASKGKPDTVFLIIVIVVPIVGFLLILLIILIIVCCCCRRKKRQKDDEAAIRGAGGSSSGGGSSDSPDRSGGESPASRGSLEADELAGGPGVRVADGAGGPSVDDSIEGKLAEQSMVSMDMYSSGTILM